MDYQKHYDNLITNARSRAKPEGYTERHHALPVSMGGTSERSNLVRLTAKEHFVAHILLFKANPSHPGMAYAAYRMSHRYLYKSSRIYASLRAVHIKTCQEIGKSHKINGTGIFAQGMQAKGGTAAALVTMTNKTGIYSEEHYGSGGKVGGKLPWWYNPKTGLSARANLSPGKEWIQGRGDTIKSSNETQRKNKSGIYDPEARKAASKLGAAANVSKNYTLGKGIFKTITCSCGKEMNPGNLIKHQKASGCVGVKS